MRLSSSFMFSKMWFFCFFSRHQWSCFIPQQETTSLVRKPLWGSWTRSAGPCLRKFKVKRDKASDRTGLSDVRPWKHTSHSICSFINLSHGPWPTNPGGGWHSRPRGVKNTSSGSRARPRVWGRGLRWWHGRRRLCMCVCVHARVWVGVYSLYVCKRLQLHDSARLFRGLRCRWASCLVNWLLFWGSCRRHRCLPGRDEAFRNLFSSQTGGGGEGASGDTWHASSQRVWLASEDLTATRHKQKPARKTCIRFCFFFFFRLRGMKRGIISFNSWLQPDRDHKQNPLWLLAW